MTDHPLLDSALANRPALRNAAGFALDAIREIRQRRQADGGDPDAPISDTELAGQLGQNAVAVNEFSAEPARQSRTAVGGSTAFLGAIVVIVNLAISLINGEPPDVDFDLLAGSGLTLWGGLTAIVGRLRGGLKPVTNWLNPKNWWA